VKVIHIEDYVKMLSMEHKIVLDQTTGLTQADSLIQPQPGGNCLNWVLGHLSENLLTILSTIAGQVPEGLPDLQRYGYGSEPVCGEGPGVLPLKTLVESYGLLTSAITARLSQMNQDEFEEKIDFWQGNFRRGYVAFFYFFHNTYHLGQLEQLRNLAGKTEKVI
jgi:hypothetical protein